MFTNEKDVILETIRLASEREQARADYEAANGAKKWGVYLPEEKALNDYLMTLDRDAVETLEALMLIGRDDEHRAADVSPEQNYLNLKEKRYHHHPDQQAAVYYLTGKKPLAQFLEEGLNYLGIIL
ncbi:MAG: DUF3775 domain-containing protein [Peptococcaceae bacterium]|jgi:hypothetical protein|nr:DUF3775 domain-containing protein [Peptococcaceae bacterium]MBQ2368807.1 DUF3775 domain-containing protein [Peptococcaceae bacterium]MBQ5707305.1 DUF3775 domain-containing protein [Peptococcaceae bacterium]MBQ5863602.1 DUF3775 domain-containing protein [Peptococcaceae bacterium]MBR0448530.1 DUF3775 domain-containing protein [Peptococcaceae bacterium]